MIPTSLAMLTWKSPVTLERTLKSLAPILPLVSEKLVLCQEADPSEARIAENAGFRTVQLAENVGIQNGLKIAVSSSTNEHVLLLENDCLLDCPTDIAAAALHSMSRLFQERKIDFGVLQEVPKNASKTFHKYWSTAPSGMRRTLLGHMRKGNADSIASEALSCLPEEALQKPYLEKIDPHVYLTTSRYRRWSNRAVYLNKSFFLETLIAFAEANPTSRRCNGHPELEHPVNCRRQRHWWRSQNFKIALAKPGLFSHRRFDRTIDDEKWQIGGDVEAPSGQP